MCQGEKRHLLGLTCHAVCPQGFLFSFPCVRLISVYLARTAHIWIPYKGSVMYSWCIQWVEVLICINQWCECGQDWCALSSTLKLKQRAPRNVLQNKLPPKWEIWRSRGFIQSPLWHSSNKTLMHNSQSVLLIIRILIFLYTECLHFKAYFK